MKYAFYLIILLSSFPLLTGGIAIPVTEKPVEKKVTVMITIPESCLNKLRCSCVSGTNPMNPISIGGGGTSNPRGRQMAALLYFESLSPEEQVKFKATAPADLAINDPEKLAEIKKILNNETSYAQLDKPGAELESKSDELTTAIKNARINKKDKTVLLEKLGELKTAVKKDNLSTF
jgi:hypothetical protein